VPVVAHFLVIVSVLCVALLVALQAFLSYFDVCVCLFVSQASAASSATASVALTAGVSSFALLAEPSSETDGVAGHEASIGACSPFVI